MMWQLVTNGLAVISISQTDVLFVNINVTKHLQDYVPCQSVMTTVTWPIRGVQQLERCKFLTLSIW